MFMWCVTLALNAAGGASYSGELSIPLEGEAVGTAWGGDASLPAPALDSLVACGLQVVLRVARRARWVRAEDEKIGVAVGAGEGALPATVVPLPVVPREEGREEGVDQPCVAPLVKDVLDDESSDLSGWVGSGGGFREEIKASSPPSSLSFPPSHRGLAPVERLLWAGAPVGYEAHERPPKRDL